MLETDGVTVTTQQTVTINVISSGRKTNEYHLTENYYIINSETIMDVNNYIPFQQLIAKRLM